MPPKLRPVELLLTPIGMLEETIEPEPVISTELVDKVHALDEDEIVDAQFAAEAIPLPNNSGPLMSNVLTKAAVSVRSLNGMSAKLSEKTMVLTKRELTEPPAELANSEAT